MNGVLPYCVLAAYVATQDMLSRGISPVIASLTLNAFFEQIYLSIIKATLRSWRDHVSRYRLHISPVIGLMLIGDIRLTHLIRLVDGLQATDGGDLSVASRNRIVALIKAIFSCAAEREYIEKNPALRLKLLRERNERGRLLTRDEAIRFFAATENAAPLVRCLILLLSLTGMRLSEALTAQWSFVDFERGLLRLPDTKGGRPRLLHLSGEALDVLHQLRALQRNEWIFPGRGDGAMTRPTKAFNAILREARVTDLWLHDLRRLAGSIAADHVPMPCVSKMLGHSHVSVTERYVITVDDQLLTAANCLGQRVSALLPAPRPLPEPQNDGPLSARQEGAATN